MNCPNCQTPNRIITATAAARDTHLLTKDESIHAHYAKAFWDKA